jgi:hypothetical protein
MWSRLVQERTSGEVVIKSNEFLLVEPVSRVDSKKHSYRDSRDEPPADSN